MQLTSTDVRQLSDESDLDRIIFFRALAGFREPDAMDESESSERMTIRMFDQWVLNLCFLHETKF
jgi:hypothetical protein